MSDIGKDIIEHPLVELVNGTGVGNTEAIRVTYQGNDIGSKRVLISSLIPPALSYTLSFSVKFCDDFDFAKGGKLHGLGPLLPIAGGKDITPAGWSARLMFRKNGGLMTYVYHQDMKGQYGDTKVAKNFRFKSGKYYNIDMSVVLNQPISLSNGMILVDVDGVRVIEHKNLKFRAVNSSDSLIQKILFNTFHGGHTPEWAPRSSDGSYKRDCAYFDDLEVSK